MTAQIQPSNSNITLPSSLDGASEGGINLGVILETLKRRAVLIAGITAAVGGAAGLRAYTNPAIYSASFDFLIQPLSVESEVLGDPLIEQETSLSLEDQIQILTSPGVLDPLVSEVRAQGMEDCTPPVSGSADTLQEEELQRQCYTIINSNLSVEGFPESDIVQAIYSSESESNAKYIADLAAQTFLDYGLSSRQRNIQQGLDFLDSKIPDLRQEVRGFENQIQNLQQTFNFLSIESKGGNVSGQVSNFENQYLDILIELEQKLDLYESLKTELATSSIETAVSPALSDNGRYQNLIADLLALDNQIAEASSIYTDNSPEIQVLNDQRENILNLLTREGRLAEQEVLSEIDVLASQELALSRTLEDLNIDIDEIATLSRQFTELQRELEIATNNLGQLMARRATLQIEAAQRELPWELITPPRVSKEIPSLFNSIAVGSLLGFLLGMGIALALDAQKGILYTAKDLKRVTPVTILSIIPWNESVLKGHEKYQLETLFQPSTSKLSFDSTATLSNGGLEPDGMHEFKEAFRSLVANLQRVDVERPIKSLTISSADDQVSDATTAAYLAWSAAETGNRVLLIDADLRDPSLHTLLDLNNEKGFSNVLSGDLELKNALCKSTIESNLFVLTAGSAYLEPAKILTVSRIRKFLSLIGSHFDLVIFSSPSFLDYADSALIAGETDGLALVSNLGKVKSAQLEQNLEKVWVSKIPLVGIIAKEAAPKFSLLGV